MSKKNILLLASGEFLEFYNFMLFLVFSKQIASYFFSPLSNNSLFFIFLLFISGYFARVVGAVVFGHIADVYGRKKSFLISILMMAFSTLLIVFIPSYSILGIYSVFFLFLCRFFQGLSLGGELPSLSVFITEKNNNLKIGLMIGIVLFSGNIGQIFAYLIGAVFENKHIVISIITPDWKLPFIFGSVIGVIIFIFRINTSESEIFLNYKKKLNCHHIPIFDLLQKYKSFIKAFFLMSTPATTYFFMISFFTFDTGISMENKLMYTSFSIAVYSIGIVFYNIISDYFDRVKALNFALILSVISIPFYLLAINNYITFFILIYSFLIGTISGVAIARLLELFESKLKCTGFALSQSFGFAVFGSLSIPFSYWLIVNIGINKNIIIPFILFSSIILTGIANNYYNKAI